MNSINPIDRFEGDFEFLPIAAHLRYGMPGHDFQSAAVLVADDLDVYAEAHWYLEATRERVLNPACALDERMSAINTRVAKRLFERRG
jgi:hypothetical protein